MRPLIALALWAVPWLYVAYMKLVFSTSRVEPGNFPELHDWIREHDGAVGLLWHEEVVSVAYGYYHLGFRPHTLASAGTLGEIITRMLKLCGFVVFRGGSSTKKSRRRPGVVNEMIEHMRNTREVIYGITVDGSQGPAYRMKIGGARIAAACERPAILARTWYKRSLRIGTWDRTAMPLPFNHIRYYLRGPYPPPPPDASEQELYRFLLRLEDDLIDLAAESYRDLGQPLPPNLVKRTDEERAKLLGDAASGADG